MNTDTIRKKIPNADPDFINIIGKLHDPSSKIFERVLNILPELHELFLKKREAAIRGDSDTFMKIVEEEVELISASEYA
jgi:hypothetical protein